MKKKIGEARIYDPIGKNPFPNAKKKHLAKWQRDWNYTTHEPPCAESESPLVNAVLAEIYKCDYLGDYSAIDELLRFVHRKYLIQFLPEDRWKHYIRKGEKII